MRHNAGHKTVYVWQLPVRIFHAINALSILTLMATGIYIGNPFVSSTALSATPAFLMGYVREVHFVAGYVFAANLFVRLYWAIAGNRYAQTRPWRKSFWIGLYKVVRYYMFIDRAHPHYTGHNPMAEASYLLFIGLGGVLLSLTGFYMLYEVHPQTFSFAMVSWLHVFTDNSIWMHYVHHWLAWVIMVFVVIHVYMSIRQDMIDKDGTVSSILTGYKTVDEGDHVS
ncbi:Ni/Fe-hydrogenase, b-type cytochrome subunit [Aneurinibacillus terranovensis]|uniref:Ni/Fe-hydrogenase, b-type cytochrome subunit n=1 Tax=Aneurinibacillus terranovensis TaxID=278991 RepID=UPI000414CE97|nr:Ni/Fe-hydrogenase, b-type cytochrome subunit [Aneurinibacillus terranovensis]